MASCRPIYEARIETSMRKQLQGDATGRLQLELGWLSVVEVMKLTQLPLPIARLTITCK